MVSHSSEKSLPKQRGLCPSPLPEVFVFFHYILKPIWALPVLSPSPKLSWQFLNRLDFFLNFAIVHLKNEFNGKIAHVIPLYSVCGALCSAGSTKFHLWFADLSPRHWSKISTETFRVQFFAFIFIKVVYSHDIIDFSCIIHHSLVCTPWTSCLFGYN